MMWAARISRAALAVSLAAPAEAWAAGVASRKTVEFSYMESDGAPDPVQRIEQDGTVWELVGTASAPDPD